MAYVLQWRSHRHSLLHSSWNYFHLPSNEFFVELWSIQLTNGEACPTRWTSFLFDLLDTIEGQNAFITRITSIKEVQHVSFHKSSGCNYGCISLCHRPFPLHFEPDSFLPDRLASIFLIPALSKLHCQNADNRLTFKSWLPPIGWASTYIVLIFINPFNYRLIVVT